MKSAKGFVEESISSVKALVRDYLTPSQTQALSSLAPGCGAMVEIDGDDAAAYRDDAGVLFVLSPVCTHLKCKVHWNALETSWDCPCHGSRFAPQGHVIEGPALRPLKRRMQAEG